MVLGTQGEAFGAEVEGEGSLAEVDHLGEEEKEAASGLLDVVVEEKSEEAEEEEGEDEGKGRGKGGGSEGGGDGRECSLRGKSLGQTRREGKSRETGDALWKIWKIWAKLLEIFILIFSHVFPFFRPFWMALPNFSVLLIFLL